MAPRYGSETKSSSASSKSSGSKGSSSSPTTPRSAAATAATTKTTSSSATDSPSSGQGHLERPAARSSRPAVKHLQRRLAEDRPAGPDSPVGGDHDFAGRPPPATI